jgi:predicted dehydrogenase
MIRCTRRRWLKSAALATAAVTLPAKAWSQVRGANEALRIGVVGVRGRGGDHLRGFSALQGVRVAALCDCDSEVLKSVAARLEKKGTSVTAYADLRKLLEDRSIDAISVATPNHWHSLAVVWACQAGKDVYVEKPVSHNVWEGRKAVEAARKYQRIVQTGTQSRSSREGIAQAVDWVRAGNLGRITMVRGLCYNRRPSIGKADGPQPIPPSIDYDLWCGPAPKEPLKRLRLHYDWHWVWPTGNGDLGNQGIHQMDIARWFLGVGELSPRVWSVGGRFGYVDDATTANTQIVYHDYRPAPLVFEVRGLPASAGAKAMDKFQGGSVAVVVHCEGGYVLVPNYNTATAFDRDGHQIRQWKEIGDHYANFVKAVRSRKREDLHAEILEGHLSSALCHLGNISYRLGTHAAPAAIRERIAADHDAAETWDRMAAHLRANEVDLAVTPAALGPLLRFDPKTERFLDNEQANQMLSRPYRAPFVVPANV